MRGVDLHIDDMSHPTAAGSYLAAAVLYATLTGNTPYGAPAVIEGHPSPEGVVDLTQTVSLADLRPETATTLQHIAWDTVSTSRGEPGALREFQIDHGADPHAPLIPEFTTAHC